MFWKLSVVNSFVPCQNKSIVDLGCGFGYMLLNLVKKADRVYAVDQNQSLSLNSSSAFAKPTDWEKKYEDLFSVTRDLIATELPSQEDRDKIILVAEEAQKMSFDDNEIDTVCALDVFEHIDKYTREDVRKEIYRILRPDGRLVYSVPNTVGLAFKLRVLVALLFGQQEDPYTEDHKKYNWKMDLKKIENYFTVLKVKKFPFSFLGLESSIIISCQKKKK